MVIFWLKVKYSLGLGVSRDGEKWIDMGNVQKGEIIGFGDWLLAVRVRQKEFYRRSCFYKKVEE